MTTDDDWSDDRKGNNLTRHSWDIKLLLSSVAIEPNLWPNLLQYCGGDCKRGMTRQKYCQNWIWRRQLILTRLIISCLSLAVTSQGTFLLFLISLVQTYREAKSPFSHLLVKKLEWQDKKTWSFPRLDRSERLSLSINVFFSLFLLCVYVKKREERTCHVPTLVSMSPVWCFLFSFLLFFVLHRERSR